MEIDNLFIKKFEGLIIDRLAAAGLYGDEQDKIKSKIYERILTSDNYDKSRGKVTTWLWHLCRSVISNELRKKKASKDVMSNDVLTFNETGATIGEEDAGTAGDELDRIFNLSSLSKRDENMMRDYHLKNCSLRDLEKKYGLNKRAVEQVIYRGMKALRAQIN